VRCQAYQCASISGVHLSAESRSCEFHITAALRLTWSSSTSNLTCQAPHQQQGIALPPSGILDVGSLDALLITRSLPLALSPGPSSHQLSIGAFEGFARHLSPWTMLHNRTRLSSFSSCAVLLPWQQGTVLVTLRGHLLFAKGMRRATQSTTHRKYNVTPQACMVSLMRCCRRRPNLQPEGLSRATTSLESHN